MLQCLCGHQNTTYQRETESIIPLSSKAFTNQEQRSKSWEEQKRRETSAGNYYFDHLLRVSVVEAVSTKEVRISKRVYTSPDRPLSWIVLSLPLDDSERGFSAMYPGSSQEQMSNKASSLWLHLLFPSTLSNPAHMRSDFCMLCWTSIRRQLQSYVGYSLRERERAREREREVTPGVFADTATDNRSQFSP